jgi:hypothetical protein
MAASAQVNSRMQLNLLACGWFVVVVDDGVAWTLMLGFDTSWLLNFVWTSLNLDFVVNELCIRLLWKELNIKA